MANSVYYLLGLWSRLVGSISYVRSDKPNMIDKYAPTLIQEFISARVRAIAVAMDQGGGTSGVPINLSWLSSALFCTAWILDRCIIADFLVRGRTV